MDVYYNPPHRHTTSCDLNQLRLFRPDTQPLHRCSLTDHTADNHYADEF